MGWKIDPKTGKSTYVFDDATTEALDMSNSSAVATSAIPTSYTEASGYGSNGGIGGLPDVGATGSTGLFGLGTTGQWGTAMGLAGTLVDAYRLPSEIKLNDAKIDLAKQQIASNNQAMADRKTFNSTWANASNGLAARSVG